MLDQIPRCHLEVEPKLAYGKIDVPAERIPCVEP